MILIKKILYSLNMNLKNILIFLRNFFSLRMFRYNLIKMLKTPSSYTFLILMFMANCAIILVFGDNKIHDVSSVTIPRKYLLYLWELYAIHFFWLLIYIGVKSLQVIKDEIDDGTLLIFFSFPISRKRIIFEKWLSLQFLVLIHSLIVLLLPLLIGLNFERTQCLAKCSLKRIWYIYLTSVVVQLLVSTFAILLSLRLGFKSMIFIMLIFSGLSIVGPTFTSVYISYSVQKSGYLSYNYIRSITNVSKKLRNVLNRLDIDSNLLNNLFNPSGWPFWTPTTDGLELTKSDVDQYNELIRNADFPCAITPTFNTDTLSNELNEAFNEITENGFIKYKDIDDFRLKLNNIHPDSKYKNAKNFLNMISIKLDGVSYRYRKIDFINPTLRSSFEPSKCYGTYIINDISNKGVNILDKFYQTLIKIKPVVNLELKNSVKCYSNSYYRSPKLDISKINVNENYLCSLDKECFFLYRLMKKLYYSGFISKTSLDIPNVGFCVGNDKNSFNALITPIVKNIFSPRNAHYEFVEDIKDLFRNRYCYGDGTGARYNLIFNDDLSSILFNYINQLSVWTFLGINKQSIMNRNNLSNDHVYSEYKKIKSLIKVLKIIGHLNIWQHWVIMWFGDYCDYDSCISEDDFRSSLFPINNFLNPLVNNLEYNSDLGNIKDSFNFISGDFSKSIEIISPNVLYIVYLILTVLISMLLISWISRKDVV